MVLIENDDNCGISVFTYCDKINFYTYFSLVSQNLLNILVVSDSIWRECHKIKTVCHTTHTQKNPIQNNIQKVRLHLTLYAQIVMSSLEEIVYMMLR